MIMTCVINSGRTCSAHGLNRLTTGRKIHRKAKAPDSHRALRRNVPVKTGVLPMPCPAVPCPARPRQARPSPAKPSDWPAFLCHSQPRALRSLQSSAENLPAIEPPAKLLPSLTIILRLVNGLIVCSRTCTRLPAKLRSSGLRGRRSLAGQTGRKSA